MKDSSGEPLPRYAEAPAGSPRRSASIYARTTCVAGFDADIGACAGAAVVIDGAVGVGATRVGSTTGDGVGVDIGGGVAVGATVGLAAATTAGVAVGVGCAVGVGFCVAVGAIVGAAVGEGTGVTTGSAVGACATDSGFGEPLNTCASACPKNQPPTITTTAATIVTTHGFPFPLLLPELFLREGEFAQSAAPPEIVAHRSRSRSRTPPAISGESSSSISGSRSMRPTVASFNKPGFARA